MTRKIRKIALYGIIGTLAFSGNMLIVKAAETPVAGIGVVLEEFYQDETALEKDITEFLTPIRTEYQDIAITTVTYYVNIRSEATEESKVLGKLHNNSAATILSAEGDWFKVKSGTVTGYVKSEYLVSGEEVVELAKKVGNRIAKVNTVTLKVREAANADATIQTLVPMGEEFEVLKEEEGWVKIAIDSDVEGYLSTDYVELRTEFKEAESLEEEAARLVKEAELEEASALEEAQEQERAQEAEEQAQEDVQEARPKKTTIKRSVAPSRTRIETKKSSNEEKEQTTSNSDSSTRSEIVNYALKFVGNPYVWGGTSLTNGADCSGFTQSVFGNKGIGISRTSRSQAGGGREISISNIQPGDLIFYDNNGRINHVGIYLGNQKVISASSAKTGIRISNYKYRQPCKVVSYID